MGGGKENGSHATKVKPINELDMCVNFGIYNFNYKQKPFCIWKCEKYEKFSAAEYQLHNMKVLHNLIKTHKGWDESAFSKNFVLSYL